VRETGLVCLLLETMAKDSEKHAKLLHFVEHRLEAQPHGTP
jgi:hypothetical protein